jgi:hypothetical protein
MRCDRIITRKCNRQKYCIGCYKEIKRYKDMMRMRRYRSIGTTNFFGHARKNKELEQKLVKLEKKRLGLR